VAVVVAVAVVVGAAAIGRAPDLMVRAYAHSVDIECRIKWAFPAML